MSFKPVIKITALLCFAACNGEDAERRDKEWLYGESTSEDMRSPVDAETHHADFPQDVEPFTEVCSSIFEPGPVWRLVPDKAAALKESRWIAVVRTSHVFKNDDGLELNEDFDSALFLQQINEVGLEIIKVIDGFEGLYWETVVSGTPAQVISLAERSCLVTGIDLTGFHCDCDPELCQRASECSLKRSAGVLGFTLNELTYSQWLHETPIVTCEDNLHIGEEYLNVSDLSPRGVRWAFVNAPSYVKSWQGNWCVKEQKKKLWGVDSE